MSYRKPRTAIKSGEPCDPTQMNEDIHPVAQELSGHVIDHNIVAGTFPQARVSDACYYQVANGGTPYYISVASDMRIVGSPNTDPRTLDANAWRVPQTSEWSLVGSSTTALSLSPVTGQSILWIIAQVQYAVANGVVSVNGKTSIFPSHLQFAIRVDGVLIEDSITGLKDVINPADCTYYPENPTDATGTGPYSIHTFTTPNTEALGISVYPVRLLTFCPVDEGTHIVEVVVRQLPNFYDPTNAAATNTYVYNRKLLVVDLHLQAPATGATFSVELATPMEGDTVSAASMHTNAVAAVVAQENNLGDGAMARNALRNTHLPSRVLFPNEASKITGFALAPGVVYPGFGAVGVGGGWVPITGAGGVGDELYTTNGPYDFTANPGFVILLANVHVSTFSNTPLYDMRTYAWFTIQGQYQSGVEFAGTAATGGAVGSAEMAIMNPNMLLDAGLTATFDPLEADVPLFEYFDFRTTPPAGGNVANFRVLGGNTYAPGGVAVPCNWRKSNIALIGLKK